MSPDVKQGNALCGPDEKLLACGMAADRLPSRKTRVGYVNVIGKVRKGEWIPDELRHMLTRAELMDAVASSGDGHGIDAGAKAMGKAYYTFDVEGTPH